MNRELQAAIASNKQIRNAWPRMLACGYAGSIAHGMTDAETDDIDLLGVFISPDSHYFGLTQIDHIVKVDVCEKYDFCLYEIRKYFRLLLNNNPNVLSLMFLPENMYVALSDVGRVIVNNRHLFMSKRLHKSFGRYAWAQINKMERACTDQAYQGAKRKERFQKFGYDCKNAAHAIRLLKMGVEALSTGEVNVHRADAMQLKAIKMGERSKESVISEAKQLMDKLDEALIHSPLQGQPDRAKAELLLMDILKNHFSS